MASRLKYQVGQHFKCLVPQRLVLGTANGVPVPFGQVASDTKRAKAQGIDVPVGTVVVLEADFQCQLPDGTTKRAYILRVEGQPVFFADRVLTRKYERVIVHVTQQTVYTPFGRGPDITSLAPSDAELLKGDPVPIKPLVQVVIDSDCVDPLEAVHHDVDARFVRACIADLGADIDPAQEAVGTPTGPLGSAWADLEAAGLCLEADARARGISFTVSDPQDGQGDA